jgi:hypothetical protein
LPGTSNIATVSDGDRNRFSTGGALAIAPWISLRRTATA